MQWNSFWLLSRTATYLLFNHFYLQISEFKYFRFHAITHNWLFILNYAWRTGHPASFKCLVNTSLSTLRNEPWILWQYKQWFCQVVSIIAHLASFPDTWGKRIGDLGMIYLGMVVLNQNWIVLPYSRKIWQGITFGNLLVRVETAKFNSANYFAHNILM